MRLDRRVRDSRVVTSGWIRTHGSDVIVKTSLVGVLLISSALLAIPVVIGGNGSTAAAGCGELAAILDTIRTVDSGGDYTAPKNRGGASGAYQYVDSTWSDYEGYESAYLAPPE